jgi:hypothetical protein
MAVFVDQPNVLALLAVVEGEKWLELQNRQPLNPQGFFVWLSAYRWRLSGEGQKEIEREGFDRAEDLPLVEIISAGFVAVDGSPFDGAIYGAGGYDRYRVLDSGEIVFLAAYAVDSARVALAKSLGFSVV